MFGDSFKKALKKARLRCEDEVMFIAKKDRKYFAIDLLTTSSSEFLAGRKVIAQVLTDGSVVMVDEIQEG